ncbi:hypothetical protein BDV23DRAFT_159041 [Aspergillus alliaceus]|uniref:Uncharacterized protein n=1 Tax=Petromyces alliaceus TaxID=209559 RepID=A0A5N7C406_PETAA|nr:hypothetical protein BDV23DRAFT_159041 [Aspergillus alliaceus]
MALSCYLTCPQLQSFRGSVPAYCWGVVANSACSVNRSSDPRPCRVELECNASRRHFCYSGM